MIVNADSAIEWVTQENDRLLSEFSNSKRGEALDAIRRFRAICKLMADLARDSKHQDKRALELFDLARDRDSYWSRREGVETDFQDGEPVIAANKLPDKLRQFEEAASSHATSGLADESMEDKILRELESTASTSALNHMAEQSCPALKEELAGYLRTNPNPPVPIVIAAHLMRLSVGLARVRIGVENLWNQFGEPYSCIIKAHVDLPMGSVEHVIVGAGIELERLCIRRSIDEEGARQVQTIGDDLQPLRAGFGTAQSRFGGQFAREAS